MQDYIHSGYYNIFRPPYSLTNSINKSTIYCISDRYNSILIIIPLVTSFYKDVVDIVKNHVARKIYIIAPDVGLPFASDYYLTWDTITNNLRKSCKIFSKYMIENYARADFINDIIRCENDSISFDVPRSDLDISTISISFSKKYVHSSTPFSCDIELNDTYRKILFVGEMNASKAEYLNNNKNIYDEIHMAFITGNYGGLTYNELLKQYPALVNKLYCNQFASREEYDYAKSRGVKVGGEYNDTL